MTTPAVNARDLVRDPASLLAITLVAAVLFGIGWFAFGSRSPSPSTNKKPTHMHCPACHEEITYNPKLAGKKCTNCSEGTVYKTTVGSIFDENREVDDGAGRFILFGLAAVIGIQGLVFAGIWRLKILREQAEAARNRTMLARCPFCKRGVTYSISKAGTWTTCYQCKTAFALPVEGTVDVVS